MSDRNLLGGEAQKKILEDYLETDKQYTHNIVENQGGEVDMIDFQQPPPAKWVLTPVPGGYLKFHMPHAPNAFHRWMQRICIGFRWERVKD